MSAPAAGPASGPDFKAKGRRFLTSGSAPAKATTARNSGMVLCPACELICRRVSPPGSPHAHFDCPRCGTRIHPRKPESLARTWALVIAAFFFYLNVFEIKTLALPS